MNERLKGVVLIGLLAGAGLYVANSQPAKPTAPLAPTPTAPKVEPKVCKDGCKCQQPKPGAGHICCCSGTCGLCTCKTCGCKKRLGDIEEGALLGAKVGGTIAPDGKTEIQIDFPPDRQRNNISSGGQGCCTHRSVGNAADWQDVPQLKDFAEWVRSKGLPGGGYPGNMKERITAICKERGMPEPRYIQVEGADLEILKLACRTGRMPGVTYSFSPTGRYGGSRIAHMLNLVHCDDAAVAIMDNNYPCTPASPNNYEWLTPAEFKRTFNGGGGWAVILLDPGPPPSPRN